MRTQCLQATSHVSNFKIDLYQLENIGGVMVDPLSKLFRDFGIRPIYFITLALEVSENNDCGRNYKCIVISWRWQLSAGWQFHPGRLLNRPMRVHSSLPSPSYNSKTRLNIVYCSLACVLLVSFLCGFLDSTSTAANSVYCSRILPGVV